MSPEKTSAWKDKAILAVLVLIFALPVLGSWYMVFYTDITREHAATLQHGILIEPPRLLENATLFDPAQNSQVSLHGKWTLMAFGGNDCDSGCLGNLYRMRQIRLAMGREMYRVQRAIFFNETTRQDIGMKILNDYPGQLVMHSQQANDMFLTKFVMNGKKPDNAIFLIDPNGYLMMHYPPETDPSGIIKDLKRLLRFSGTN